MTRHEIDDMVCDLNDRLIEAMDSWLRCDLTDDDASKLAAIADEPPGMAAGTLRDQVAARIDATCERLRLHSYRVVGVVVQPAAEVQP